MKAVTVFNNAPARADLVKLCEPFAVADIEWRMGRAGKTREGKFWGTALAYVTNRAIMERLDTICGPDNWRNEYTKGPEGGILCGLSIRVCHLSDSGDSFEWVTKWDGAENTDIEKVKGGLSGAMKRAAVQWGIGRYLYDLTEGWVTIVPNRQIKGARAGKTKQQDGGETFYWTAPELPAWALPTLEKAS